MSQHRVLFLYKLDDVADLAIQHITESVQRVGIDGLSLLDTVQGIRRKALLKNQMIFGDSLFKKRFIKWLITDHFPHQRHFIILNLLTILKILSIM